MNERRRYFVQVFSGDREVVSGTYSARTAADAGRQAFARTSLDVEITKVMVDGEQIYPFDRRTLKRGSDYAYRVNAQYRIGVNTSRTLRSTINAGDRGDFVDAAIREKLKSDFGVNVS